MQWLNRGRTALAQEQPEQAIGHLRQALALAPNHHELHFALAQAYANLGQVQPARQHLERTLQNSTSGQQQAAYESKLTRLRPLPAL